MAVRLGGLTASLHGVWCWWPCVLGEAGLLAVHLGPVVLEWEGNEAQGLYVPSALWR